MRTYFNSISADKYRHYYFAGAANELSYNDAYAKRYVSEIMRWKGKDKYYGLCAIIVIKEKKNEKEIHLLRYFRKKEWGQELLSFLEFR